MTGLYDKRSVEELELAVRESPDDLELREALCYALVRRCTLVQEGDKQDEDEQDEQLEADTAQIREILSSLPPQMALYARAYIAMRDFHNWVEGASLKMAAYLAEYAVSIGNSRQTPLTCDEFVKICIRPFNSSYPFFSNPGYIDAMVDVFRRTWPKSAVVWTLRGLSGEINDTDTSFYKRAVLADRSFWYAAQLYAEEAHAGWDWEEAIEFGLLFLETQSNRPAKEIAPMYWLLAECYEELSNQAEAEKYYRHYLETTSDDTSRCEAQYFIWRTVVRQGKLKEAHVEFEKCLSVWSPDEFLLQTNGEFLWRTGDRDIVGFTMEKQLENKLAELIQQSSVVFERNLRFGNVVRYRQLSNEDGKRMDLCAEHVGQDEYLIIELKRDIIDSKALNQIIGSITTKRQDSPRQNITGILCGYSVSKEVLMELAQQSTHNIEVWVYRYVGETLYLKKLHPAP